MKTLNDIKKDINLINEIDWNMTNEKAVGRYLEWGGSWFEKDDYPVRGGGDHSIYFIINNWNKEPLLYLVKRDSQGTDELAKIEIPKKLKKSVLKSIGGNKGIYEPEEEIKSWLKKELSL